MNRNAPQHRRPNGRQVDLFDTPSGLGGTFTVFVLDELPEGRCRVQVYDPTSNLGFHGLRFMPLLSDLRPTGLKARVEVQE